MSEILQLYDKMLQYGKAAPNREVYPANLTKTLRKFIGTCDIKLKTRRDPKVDLDQVVVGGCYDPEEDQANFASITLYVIYSPNQKVILFKNLDWPQLCAELIECVGHEKIHQSQYRKRKFDIGSNIFISMSTDKDKRLDQEYLGSPDEIEAYGFSIAAEVHLKYNPKALSKNYILESAIYRIYRNSFGAEHIVVNKLLKYADKYFKQLSSK